MTQGVTETSKEREPRNASHGLTPEPEFLQRRMDELCAENQRLRALLVTILADAARAHPAPDLPPPQLVAAMGAPGAHYLPVKVRIGERTVTLAVQPTRGDPYQEAAKLWASLTRTAPPHTTPSTPHPEGGHR